MGIFKLMRSPVFHKITISIILVTFETTCLVWTLQIANPSTLKPLYLDEEWLRRRSERIFLSEPSPQPSPNTTKDTQQKSPTIKRQATLSPTPVPKVSPKSTLTLKSNSEKAKLQKAKSMKELTDKVKRKYTKAFQFKNRTKDMGNKTENKEVFIMS